MELNAKKVHKKYYAELNDNDDKSRVEISQIGNNMLGEHFVKVSPKKKRKDLSKSPSKSPQRPKTKKMKPNLYVHGKKNIQYYLCDQQKIPKNEYDAP